jgi:hypothetical protein
MTTPRRHPPPDHLAPAELVALIRAVAGGPAAVIAELGSRGDAGAAALDEAPREAVAALWTRGWTPEDVAREGAAAAMAELTRLVVLAEAAHARHPPHLVGERWRDQLVALAGRGAGADSPVRRRADYHGSVHVAAVEGVQLLLMLDRKPPLPFVLAPPGMRQDVFPGRRPEAIPEKVIERIRALLHKAERTDFPAEAESFMAKAQELMALHSIERAMLDHADRDEPAAIRIYLDDPYAAANRCRAVHWKELGFVMVFGYPADLEGVELLHTSLLVQATAAMTAHGPVRDARGRVRTRSFRASFLVGFAGRIGERLREAHAVSVAQAAATRRTDLAPVLARRDRAVDDAVARVFPALGRAKVSLTNGAGWAAVRVAADRASLGTRASLSASSPPTRASATGRRR